MYARPAQSLKLVMHGGDGKLETELSQIVEAFQSDEFPSWMANKRVAYVAVALEPLEGKSKNFPPRCVKDTFSKVIRPFFEDLQVASVNLVNSGDLTSFMQQDVAILCGGDTPYLLQTLKDHKIAARLKSGDHQLKVVAGIGAGAIAIATRGVGMSNGVESVFNGMGLYVGMIVPHSDAYPERRTKYPDGVHVGANAIIRYP